MWRFNALIIPSELDYISISRIRGGEKKLDIMPQRENIGSGQIQFHSIKYKEQATKLEKKGEAKEREEKNEQISKDKQNRKSLRPDGATGVNTKFEI